MEADVVEIWSPVKGFIPAGTIILFATVVLWALLNLPMRSDADLVSAGIDPTDSTAVSTYTMNNSIAASLGHGVEPVFDPLGFDWKTNVAVLSSLAARETFVATLGQMSAAEDPRTRASRLEAARYDDGENKGRRSSPRRPSSRCSSSSCTRCNALRRWPCCGGRRQPGAGR